MFGSKDRAGLLGCVNGSSGRLRQEALKDVDWPTLGASLKPLQPASLFGGSVIGVQNRASIPNMWAAPRTGLRWLSMMQRRDFISAQCRADRCGRPCRGADATDEAHGSNGDFNLVCGGS